MTGPRVCPAATRTSCRATLTSVAASGIPVSEIRYTTDGTTPTASSPLYTGDFFIDHTTTVKFFAKDIAGNVEPVQTQTVVIDIAPPVTQIQCDGGPCAPSYNHPVNATLSATDQGGGILKEIRYTTDGSAPTASSQLYTGGIPISSTTTVKFRAEDQAGNVETPKSQTIVIDTANPTSSIQCDGAACSNGFYNHAVSATLSGNDTGGSGLKNIRYTTDGSAPTASSPVYSGPINVGSTTTIKWRAEDNAGNVESPVNSQTISIDLQNPTSSIQCDGGPCSAGGYNHPIDVTLSATDSGAAGVKEIRYTTDGSNPTASSSLYTGPVTINTTTTIKWRAEDNAGNVESTRSQQVLIENTDARHADPVRRRGLLEQLLQPLGQRHPVGDRLRRLDRQGDPLHDGRLDPRLLEHALQRPDPGQLHDHDQVPGGGQRGQHRDAEVADHLDRHGQSVELDPVRWGGLRELLLQPRGRGDPGGHRQRRLRNQEHPLHDRRLDAERLQPGLLGHDHGSGDRHDQVAG